MSGFYVEGVVLGIMSGFDLVVVVLVTVSGFYLVGVLCTVSGFYLVVVVVLVTVSDYVGCSGSLA